VLYEPGAVPFQPFSRWMHMPWNGWEEADLRTPGQWIAVPLASRDSE
jgi:hypothetical protein